MAASAGVSSFAFTAVVGVGGAVLAWLGALWAVDGVSARAHLLSLAAALREADAPAHPLSGFFFSCDDDGFGARFGDGPGTTAGGGGVTGVLHFLVTGAELPPTAGSFTHARKSKKLKNCLRVSTAQATRLSKRFCGETPY